MTRTRTRSDVHAAGARSDTHTYGTCTNALHTHPHHTRTLCAQADAGFVGTDGKHYPPRWVLNEMMVRGMHHLL